MKNIALILTAFLWIACSNDKKEMNVTVDGTIRNANAKTIYLELNTADARPMIMDSAKLDASGKFSMKADVLEESLFSLRTDVSPYPFALLINDAKKITVDADLANTENSYKITGSEASASILQFEKSINDIAVRIYQLKKELDSISQMKATDSVTQQVMDSSRNVAFNEYNGAAGQMKETAINAITESKSPMFVLYALGSFQVRSRQVGETGFTNTEISGLLEKAAARFPQHTALNEQKKKIGSNKAPDISLPDTTGKMVSLSSFRGKYVLVDFWASWCKPCRMENPNIVAAFNRFKDKNFTILGVSLDKDRASWLQAIRADGLTWTHISDLQHWNSAAAQLYSVNSIPYNVLVDPEGKIIAEGLHGPELTTTLERILQ